MNQLPNHWERRPLADVAEVRLGRQRSPKNHAGPQMRPYLRAANVGWSGLLLDDVKTMNFSDPEMEVYRLQPGDLLLSEASGSPREVGKPALWSGEIGECAFQNTLIRVRPQGPEPRYLLLFFRYVALTGQFTKESRGVGIHHLGQAKLASWLTPLPPIEEQRRMVNILEDHLSRLDAAKHDLINAELRTKQLQFSALEDLFSQISGERTTLARIAEWGSGGTPPARTKAYYEGGTIPWANSGDLKDGPLIHVPRQITSLGFENSATKWVPAGTVLIAMYGATIGKLAITTEPVTTNQAVAHAVPHPPLQAEFLFWYLRAQRRKFVAAGRGGAQPNISQSILRAWPIVIPDPNEQTAIVRKAQDLFSASDRLFGQARDLRGRSSALHVALLRAAFSGALTSQTFEARMVEEMPRV